MALVSWLIEKVRFSFCLCSALADGLGRVSRGVQHIGLLGIFSTNSVVRLEKSPNRLRYFPPVGNTRAYASIMSVVHCRALYIAYSATWFLFLITGKLQWTDGLKEG